MHLPDGILSPSVWIPADVLAAGVVAVCAKKSAFELTDRSIPMMGVLGAFVFAAQMINFPIPGGTSGHLMGSMLLMVLLGPCIATVVMCCVLVIQALLFQDGGLTVLGPNLINMGIAGIFIGNVMVRRLAGSDFGLRKQSIIFFACWFSVVLGAVLASLELWLSTQVPFFPLFLTMAGIHSLIGVGEGLITLATLRFLIAARPEIMELTR